LFELGTPRKRIKFFSRLCHDYRDYLDVQHMQETTIEDNAFVRRLRCQLSKSEAACFTMAYDGSLDRHQFFFDKGMALFHETRMPLILLISPTLAVFQAEAVRAKPPRFLLRFAQ